MSPVQKIISLANISIRKMNGVDSSESSWSWRLGIRRFSQNFETKLGPKSFGHKILCWSVTQWRQCHGLPLIWNIRISFLILFHDQFFFIFIFIMGWDSPIGTATTLWPIVPVPDDRWWWLWSNRWNANWQGKPKYSEKTCPSATLSTTSITLIKFFFNLGIVGGEVQTGSTRHLGHLLSYCAWPGWLWGWRIIRWNEDWKGKPKYSEKTYPSTTFSTTNPTWLDPGLNTGRRGGKPATNRLSYGAAQVSHDLTPAQTRAAVMESRLLTALSMAQSSWPVTRIVT
jgi:hypothetical protein